MPEVGASTEPVRLDKPAGTIARVATNLWMGAKPPPDRRVNLNFDVLVLLAGKDEYGYEPSAAVFPGIRLIWREFDDGKLSPHQASMAVQIGEFVANAMVRGLRCVVTCNMGLNRSGLVCGIALIARGMSAERAIARIRSRRHANALFNQYFVTFLYDYAHMKGR
jgi:protein-tyrosine phosphatase